MEQYLRVFVNPQQDDWVKWLPLAKFAANNGTSQTAKCTPSYAVQGTDSQMSVAEAPAEERDQQRIDVDPIHATMQQIYEHLRVAMRRSQAGHQDGANSA